MAKGNIRSKLVSESLLDYAKLADSIKENTKDAVLNLLNEAVRDTYANILTEGDEDKDYTEDEVEGTETQEVDATQADADAATDVDAVDGDEALTSDEGMDDSGETEEEITSDEFIEDKPAEGAEEGGDEEWAEFDKYKTEGGEYDFSNAQDEDIVKVYKLMKDDDQVVVSQEGGMIHVQDNETRF